MEDFNENKQINYGNFEVNIDFLLNNNLIKKNQKILEIGSGNGALLNFFEKKGFNIEGVEINKDYYKKAKKLFGDNLPLHLTGATELNYENEKFDVVISFDVLEHIPNTDRHLKEIKRILKSSGRYCFGMPNRLTDEPFCILTNKSFTKYKKPGNHCSLHTYWGIRKRLRKNGFSCKFYNQNVMTDWLLLKVKRHFGIFGIIFLKLFNPNYYPTWMKPTLYIEGIVKK